MVCEYCGVRFALDRDELDAVGFVDANNDGVDDRDQGFGVNEDLGNGMAPDTSSDPMPVFARERCEEVLENTSGDEDDFESSRKIERGLELQQNDEVFLIHDDTMFKSGKNGFAITYEGIYCREFMEDAIFVSWDDFARGKKPERDDSYMRQGKKPLTYYTGSGEVQDELEDLIMLLWNHAQRMR
jgi:hypothetical protein